MVTRLLAPTPTVSTWIRCLGMMTVMLAITGPAVGQNQPQPFSIQAATTQPVQIGPTPPAVQITPLTTQPAPISKDAGIPEPTVQLKPGEVPAISFDAPDYNFGRARAGLVISHEFVFTNTGTGPLEILRVQPACGCTLAGEYDKIVQPGQKGKIPFRLETEKLKGQQNKIISIYNNAGGRDKPATLKLIGEVWTPLDVAPTVASFGRLPRADAEQKPIRKLTLVNNMEAPADIKDVKSTNPAFSAKIVPLDPGKKFELEVTLVDAKGSGSISGNIEMSTGIREKPTLQVPAHAYISPDVSVMPNMLTIPADRKDLLKRQFVVRNDSKAPIKISELTATNPSLKLDLSETTPGVAYMISVDVPVDYKVATGGDKITFKTDCPAQPEVVIPIHERRMPNLGEVQSKAFGKMPIGATTQPAQVGTPPVQPSAGEAKPAQPPTSPPSQPPPQPGTPGQAPLPTGASSPGK